MDFRDYYEAAVRLGWFDPCHYFDLLQSEGISIRETELSLFEHYAGIGWKGGLSPSERFSVTRYLSRYPDAAESQVDPLYHYLVTGRGEQREAFPRLAPEGVTLIGLVEDRSRRRARSAPQRRAETVAGQVALAQAHGISAFCIHYDRSRGREVLDDIGAETPFCLLFDNRTWVHRQAGAGALETQCGLLAEVLEILADRRYLRVLGKPLLVIYRPERLEDAAATFEHWRGAARRAGLAGLFLTALPFYAGSGRGFGLDGLIDAPAVPGPVPCEIEDGPGEGAQQGLAQFPGFLPDRDLSKWRGCGDNAPEFFRTWLTSAGGRVASLARRDLPQLVFVDGRNGWAEGTQGILTDAGPTTDSDDAALSQLRRFAEAILAASRLPVLFVCETATRSPPTPIRRLISSLERGGGIKCFLLIAGKAGSRGPDRRATSLSLGDLDGLGWDRERSLGFLARSLRARGDLVMVSDGLATADLLSPLAGQGHGLACLVQELSAAAEPGIRAAAASMSRCAHRIVASSEPVRQRIVSAGAIPAGDIELIAPPPDAGESPAWSRYVEDIRECLTGLGNEGRRVRLTGGTLGRQTVADDLCAVIPSYNHRRFILAALDSILAQSIRPGEIRIIDDGSTDGSAELVRSLASEELGIIVEARENRGAHATINEAIAATNCPIIAVLNSDDRWHPGRIEQLIGGLRRRAGADVVFSRLRFIGPEGRCEEKRRWYEAGIADYRNGKPLWWALMFCNFLFTTSNLIVRRESFLELGGFGPLRYCHDLDFILKAIFAGQNVQFVEQTLCDYRIHETNTIEEDVQKVVFEEAWLTLKHLRRNFGQLREVERLKLAQRICDKGLATRMLAILRAAVRDGLPLDDALVHTDPRLRADLDLSGASDWSEADRREFVHEMAQFVLAQGAAPPPAARG